MSDDADDSAHGGDGGDDTDHPERLDQCKLPRCPRCGTPIAQRTMIGPGEAVAGPCGCRVAPNVGTRSDSDPD
ncbi:MULTISPECIES: hypothetical protein [Natrialba]|uniref:Small CPxCG-related zinc finger protein n=1 Tax=Natrialba asiatica (strain ATCC 700177 / DSM 12278 / JCM 9576 / FERM P-10747 / NBRC 102637 / 172P1) TaxID=29540 RepID=M0AKY2_NATA1|nr:MULTISPECIES: hypothetical protein [Natrialba]ELY99390.1 hypothetical protein C481_16105 [Natrialba asiatica DSM 12278]